MLKKKLYVGDTFIMDRMTSSKYIKFSENTTWTSTYYLIDFLTEHFGDSSQEDTGVKVASTIRAGICEGSSVELCSELTVAVGLHCLPAMNN